MIDHFKGVNETERYNNDLLNEVRKTNQLLEQLAQLLKQNKGDNHETTIRSQPGRGNKRNT